MDDATKATITKAGASTGGGVVGGILGALAISAASAGAPPAAPASSVATPVPSMSQHVHVVTRDECALACARIRAACYEPHPDSVCFASCTAGAFDGVCVAGKDLATKAAPSPEHAPIAGLVRPAISAQTLDVMAAKASIAACGVPCR